jgi:DNA-binding NarL/FixJ family response regulator
MHDLPKPLQVYVVEDSPIIRRLLGSAIAAAGGELIGFAAEAPVALSQLAVLEPDLILIDLALKSGSGFDVLEGLRAGRRRVIKVVLTNHANEQFRQLALDMGANGFFDKSTDTSQVLALINALAQEKRAAQRVGQRSSTVHRMDRNDGGS